MSRPSSVDEPRFVYSEVASITVCMCVRARSRKLYVVLSVVLCLLASSLVAFFLYPRSVVVVDDGIHTVAVHFDHPNTRVLMNMTVASSSFICRALFNARQPEHRVLQATHH